MRIGVKHSIVSTTFAFGPSQGNVGELLPVQMVVTSRVRTSTASITLSHIWISFDDSLPDIKIEHQPDGESIASAPSNTEIFEITLSTEISETDPPKPTSSSSPTYLLSRCDLSFNPGTAKALSLHLVPKVAGTVRVASITSTIETETFSMDYITSGADHMHQIDYWLKTAQGIGRRSAGNKGLNEIRIYPKPPKLQIVLPDLRKEYLTDECIQLDLGVTNEEDDDVDVTLEIRFLGQADAVPTWTWISDDKPSISLDDPLSDSTKGSKPVARISLGQIHRSESRKSVASFTARSLPTEAVLEVKALYHLLGEPDTPISKVLIHEMIFDRPFEADFDYQPCVDTRPWPSYFHVMKLEEGEKSAQGLKQLWHSSARLASLTAGPLTIEDVALKVVETHDGAICSTLSIPTTPVPEATINPNDSHESRFEIHAQKLDLDDRSSAAIQFQLQVRWRRKQSSAISATTVLTAPDLVIPFGEPRVLASAGSAQEHDETISIPLSYTIENPSSHVLNFEISMETSDEFAFSGPKTTILNLVPTSRKSLRYHIVPLVRGKWITPQLRVLDTHFRQVLRVNGTAGMRNDRNGASVWIDAED